MLNLLLNSTHWKSFIGDDDGYDGDDGGGVLSQL